MTIHIWQRTNAANTDFVIPAFTYYSDAISITNRYFTSLRSMRS